MLSVCVSPVAGEGLCAQLICVCVPTVLSMSVVRACAPPVCVWMPVAGESLCTAHVCAIC